jgi:hypothetical protein
MWMSKHQKEQMKRLMGAMEAAVGTIAKTQTAKEVNAITPLVKVWKPWVYNVGDVRLHFDIPYKCCQAHDSTENPDWSPDKAPALWIQYHGTSVDTARHWVRPTGAHDQYEVGEWMIYTDGAKYECISNTVFSPEEYAQAWRRDAEE